MKKRRMGSANIHLQKLDQSRFFLKGLPRNRAGVQQHPIVPRLALLLMRLIIKK